MTRLSAPKNVEIWECSGCGSAYFGKPDKCENAGRFFWSGLPTECEKETIKKRKIVGIIGYLSDPNLGGQVQLALKNDETDYIEFIGKTSAEREASFCQHLDPSFDRERLV